MCGLYVFSHPNAFGVAPAAALTSRITLVRDGGDQPPRSYTDYRKTVTADGLPDGVTLEPIVDLWQ